MRLKKRKKLKMLSGEKRKKISLRRKRRRMRKEK